MSEYYKCCAKCGDVIKTSSNTLNEGRCPEGGLHRWLQLCIAGDVKYKCRFCGSVVYAKVSMPANAGGSSCRASRSHEWDRQ